MTQDLPQDISFHQQSAHDTMAGMLQAASLSALAGIRHAFFTRDGGVSDGIYASLNGGPGSDDAPATGGGEPRRAWRRRSASRRIACLPPTRFIRPTS